MHKFRWHSWKIVKMTSQSLGDLRHLYFGCGGLGLVLVVVSAGILFVVTTFRNDWHDDDDNSLFLNDSGQDDDQDERREGFETKSKKQASETENRIKPSLLFPWEGDSSPTIPFRHEPTMNQTNQNTEAFLETMTFAYSGLRKPSCPCCQ